MVRPNVSLILGVIGGFSLSLLLTTLHTVWQSGQKLPYSAYVPSASGHKLHLPDLHDLSTLGKLDRIHGNAAGGQNARVVKFEDLHAHHDDDSVAKEMARRVRVLVWVMTSPQNLDKKAIHVQNTWGKRANTLLFMSSQWNSSFPTIGLNVSEGREHLTAKTMEAFRYIYKHHFDDADWFMKADDDTYVIMENLHYMLSAYDNKDPIYFGHAFKVIVKQGYTSGGAGYVISKESLRRLAIDGIPHPKVCRADGGAEDAEIGKCLMNLGVKLVPSLDRLGRSRFHCFAPEAHIQGNYAKWYQVYDAYGAKSGIDNVSDYPVTFHYISPSKMYAMEYFVYHLRPYGVISRSQSLNVLNQ
ncbi:hypothetical protein ACOMHN_029160 [Nucella lapillus]